MIDPFATLLDEIEFGIALLRPHYPDEDDGWPTDGELAATKAHEAEMERIAAERRAKEEAERLAQEEGAV